MIHVLDLRNLTFLDIIYFSLHLILNHENSKLYISEVTSVLSLVINSNEKINVFRNYTLFFSFQFSEVYLMFLNISEVKGSLLSSLVSKILSQLKVYGQPKKRKTYFSTYIVYMLNIYCREHQYLR